jgi:hypothetical protein
MAELRDVVDDASCVGGGQGLATLSERVSG